MSKVKSRGEVSPLTAVVVTLCILMVSGLSVWRVIRETPASVAVPTKQIEPVKVPADAGSGIFPKQQPSMSAGASIRTAEDK